MIKKFLSFVFIGLLFNLTTVSYVFSQSAADKDVQLVEKVKRGVMSLGTGENTHIEIKLKDGKILKGYIKESNDTGLKVIDKKTGAETIIEYPQVRQVKGKGMSTGKKVAIGFGIAGAVLGALFIYAFTHLD